MLPWMWKMAASSVWDDVQSLYRNIYSLRDEPQRSDGEPVRDDRVLLLWWVTCCAQLRQTTDLLRRTKAYWLFVRWVWGFKETSPRGDEKCRTVCLCMPFQIITGRTCFSKQKREALFIRLSMRMFLIPPACALRKVRADEGGKALHDHEYY